MIEQIGFVGLGNMGSGMAANLIQAGYTVIVFDIDPIKLNALEKLGARRANSLTELAKVADCVILCLPHPDISREVIFKGLLSDQNSLKLIVESSTLSPNDVLDISSKLKESNVEFLSTPMLGGKKAAQSKQIHFLVESDETVAKEVKDLLKAMGSRIDYMGPAPAATLAKLAYNICRYANLVSSVEVTRLIRSFTQDTQPIYNLLVEGSRDNFGKVWEEDIKSMMLEGIVYQPSSVPEKDLGLIVQLAKEHSLQNDFYNSLIKVYRSLG